MTVVIIAAWLVILYFGVTVGLPLATVAVVGLGKFLRRFWRVPAVLLGLYGAFLVYEFGYAQPRSTAAYEARLRQWEEDERTQQRSRATVKKPSTVKASKRTEEPSNLREVLEKYPPFEQR